MSNHPRFINAAPAFYVELKYRINLYFEKNSISPQGGGNRILSHFCFYQHFLVYIYSYYFIQKYCSCRLHLAFF